jgi:hypothetical protein
MMIFVRLLREASQKHGLCIVVSLSLHVTVFSPHTPIIWDRARPVQHLISLGRASRVLNDATAAGHLALGPSFTFWLARSLGQVRELWTAEVLRSRI